MTENVFGMFIAFAVAAVPLALGVTKAVEFVRRLTGSRGWTLPGWFWIGIAFMFGVALCVGWQFNLMSALVRSIPALANTSRLDGVAGQVLTGLAVGAMSGLWHDKIEEIKSREGRVG